MNLLNLLKEIRYRMKEYLWRDLKEKLKDWIVMKMILMKRKFLKILLKLKITNIIDWRFNGSVVLVGPTGVGKTTTIAKLAGRLALNWKKESWINN